MKRSLASLVGFTIAASGCNFDMFSHNTSQIVSYGSSAGISANVKNDSSAISRNSGAATQIRLAGLFPNASQTGIFNPANFSFLNSSGIYSTLGADTKPTTALAQIALRQQATMLCNNQVGGSSDQSTIFSTTDILLSGEALPKDPAEALVFAAARNVWLDAYTMDMPELQALLVLYKNAKATITGGAGDSGARRAVCEATILAPQFWMGGPLATDVIRKVAIEIGRRRPTFSEISAYKNGSLTLSAYVEKIQKEKGYLSAVNDWHQAWLGLRNFMPDGDPRGDSQTGNGGTVNGASWFNGLEFRIANPPTNASFADKIYYPTSQHDLYPQVCQPVPENFDPRTLQMVWEQRDTNPAPPTALPDEGWNIIGASVHVDGVSGFKSRLRALYFNQSGQPDAYSADRNASRSLMAQVYGDENAMFTKLCAMPVGTTSWYSCNGVVLLPATLRATLEAEYASVMSHQSSTWTDGKDSAHPFYSEKIQLDTILVWNSDHSHIVHMITPLSGIGYTNWAWLPVIAPAGFNVNTGSGQSYAAFYGNNDGAYVPLGSIMNWPSATGLKLRSPISYFQPGWRKLRRYTPSGEQVGYSTVSTWYKGTTVRVCNNMDRFAASCFYRPTSGNAQYVDQSQWNAASANLTDIDGGHGVYFPSFANYQNLSNFKCGSPVVGDIVSGATTAYPLGYDYTLQGDGAYHYGNIQSLATLAAPAGLGDDTGTSDDTVAMQNIRSDVTNEPYHLIDYLVLNNMDYRQILTANYTCGGRDFARYYQTQGYFLPIAPEQINSNIGKVGNTCSVTNGDQNLFRVEHQGITMSMNYTKNVNNFQSPASCTFLTVNTASKDRSPGQYECVNNLPSVNGTGYGLGDINPPITAIPERTMAGILTMPAFVAPVMPSPRTLSSRFFSRLLCGDPSMFKPTADQTTMQSAFVSGRSHLQPQCISCHINLDPLASAFSSSFKYFEGSGMYSMMGEYAPGGQAGFYNLVGLRSGGGSKGQGAFFGQKVNGIEELGAAVANSSQFASCVVQKTFQNVMGRTPAATDATFITAETSRFQNGINYNYNKLVEDIVLSTSFTEKQ